MEACLKVANRDYRRGDDMRNTLGDAPGAARWTRFVNEASISITMATRSPTASLADKWIMQAMIELERALEARGDTWKDEAL